MRKLVAQLDRPVVQASPIGVGWGSLLPVEDPDALLREGARVDGRGPRLETVRHSVAHVEQVATELRGRGAVARARPTRRPAASPEDVSDVSEAAQRRSDLAELTGRVAS